MFDLRTTAKSLINLTWASTLVAVILIVIIRIVFIMKNKDEKIYFYREIINLLFLIYILQLFQIVTTNDINLYVGGINLVPFKEMTRYSIGSLGFIKNTLGNIVLFIPYGFFCFYYTKEKRISVGFIVAILASFCIEFVQFLIGRAFDIDDIILNVIGAIIGFLIYKLLFLISKAFNIKKYHIIVDILTFVIIITLIALVGWWLK